MAALRGILLGSSDSICERKALEGLLEGEERGRGYSERLFGLVLLELWCREYGVSL